MKEILDKIIESGLTPNQYFLLYGLANKVSVPGIDEKAEIDILENLGHISNGEVTSDLFDERGEELGFHMKAVNYSRLFPPIILPTGVHARGKLHPVKTKLKAFIKAFPHDWDVIYQATEKYIERYRQAGYLYMQNASNFIFDKNGDSTLALEIDTLEYTASSGGIDNESI